MKTKHALTVLATVAATLFAQASFAQDTTATPTNKNGTVPAGEGPGNLTKAPGTSTQKSRMERKSETKAAAKSGDLTPAGEGPGTDNTTPSTSSNKSRAQRKAETKAAAKAGDLTPAGEGPTAPKK